jgi:hypothetical protein
VGDIIEGRTINSVNIAYNDGSSFTTTVECGPVSFAASTAGGITQAKRTTVQAQGIVLSEAYGALYVVSVPVLGAIKAYNMDKYPWDIGDQVQITIYNFPGGF